MNQKKHLNAIAALSASADAEPDQMWNGVWCIDIDCKRCYADDMCDSSMKAGERRAALQIGLDAYNKRKAEKAERRAADAAIPTTRDPDATKRRFTLAERRARMRKWAEAVIKHYSIPDEDAATVWQPGMMDSRLLADEVIAYLADEARRQGWKR